MFSGAWVTGTIKDKDQGQERAWLPCLGGATRTRCDGDIDNCILSGRDVQGLKDGIKFPIGDPRGIPYVHRGQIVLGVVLGVVHSLGG